MCESPRSGTSSSTKISLNSCSHSWISELARLESADKGLPRSILISFLFDFGWLGPQRVAPFYHQHWNLTQALERCHFQFDSLFLESHNHLMMLLVKKTSLEKVQNKASPVLKVSLKLNDENWRTNSLTSLEPR